MSILGFLFHINAAANLLGMTEKNLADPRAEKNLADPRAEKNLADPRAEKKLADLRAEENLASSRLEKNRAKHNVETESVGKTDDISDRKRIANREKLFNNDYMTDFEGVANTEFVNAIKREDGRSKDVMKQKEIDGIYNEVCGDAEPKLVLHYFEEICKIPHGSYHTQEISDYLVKFAKDRKLEYTQDEAGNVIIKKPASEGAASQEAVILQGHMDMVLEKRDDCTIDLTKQHIHLLRDGDTLYADGTTLGGDDGAAVAIMLAALDDETLVHPPLECIFTVNEEVGMLGAEVLDVSGLAGRRMINLDSEEEGIFTVGCAGGAEEHCSFLVERKPRCGKELTLNIWGLKGGHSGACIGEGRANAILVLGRVLYRLSKKVPFRLVTIDGGTKDNAIPRSASAKLILEAGEDDRLAVQTIEKVMKQIQKEYVLTDPDIQYKIDWTDASELAVDTMTKKDTKKILRFLMLTPNGLIETDGADHTMPQTSLNLGILTTDPQAGSVNAVYLVRSSINSQKKFIQQKIETLVSLLGGETEVKGAYPAWERVNDSPFVAELAGIYEKFYGKKPVVSVTHGGLECGLIAAKLKGLDCVSIGPDMEGIHTPDEKLSITSTKKIWDFLVAALKEL